LRPRSIIVIVLGLVFACGRTPGDRPANARNLILFTIDTLRADRVGAYGHSAARTPNIDALARQGVLFTNAFATAPITLPSHASILTGRYPPGHGARHNGIRVKADVPILPDALSRAGFATAAFVGAFPLDRRFGLIRGFGTYGDQMPRAPGGQPANERPGRDVADEAIAWLGQHLSSRFFVWVHFFEPHAPYGNARDGRPTSVRYDDEIAEADRQVGRVLGAVRAQRAATVVAFTADHGEAFGEHGEIAHSIFVYDTTLQVPLVLAGPSLPARQVDVPVSHVDLAPTLMRLLGVAPLDADGVDLRPAIEGRALSSRDLYAESFAPLLDFGWSPLHSIRADGWKFIEAPRPELYEVSRDASEQHDRASADVPRVSAMRERLKRYGAAADLQGNLFPDSDRDARARLLALGYVSGSGARTSVRPDPKDRRELAAQLARVISGELHGSALESALRDILRLDPANPQAHLRLGYVLQESGRCDEATPHFERAISAQLPTADAHLGLAACLTAARRFDAAIRTLQGADRIEPDNPVVIANLGLVLSDSGRPAAGLPHLQRALALDPSFDQARFYLAVTLGRLGRKDEASKEADELLRRLSADAPQRAEVERLVNALK
jgi:arylsulfatase A-like enzyme/cytochrome c-type biogenesis protein CcmH/NrfG